MNESNFIYQIQNYLFNSFENTYKLGRYGHNFVLYLWSFKLTKKLVSGNYQKFCVFLVVFVFKWIPIIEVIQTDQVSDMEWYTCVIILNRNTFESQNRNHIAFVDLSLFLEIIYLAFPLSYIQKSCDWLPFWKYYDPKIGIIQWSTHFPCGTTSVSYSVWDTILDENCRKTI